MTNAFLLECASRNLSLSSSMILINGAGPLGVSCCAQQPSVPQPKEAFPTWFTITQTPALLPPSIACHWAWARAAGADWGYRSLCSCVSTAWCASETGASPLFFIWLNLTFPFSKRGNIHRNFTKSLNLVIILLVVTAASGFSRTYTPT